MNAHRVSSVRGVFRGLVRWIAFPLLLSAACAQAAGPVPSDVTRVLFIGNSLTYGNDLPGMARQVAASAGLRWEVHSVVIGGASLEDHMNDGTAPEKLRTEKWNYVVLQQGPSTLPESRTNLRQGAAAFRPLIEGAGAKAALYMVWPDSTWSAARFMEDFDRIRDAYALAARDINGIFLPAGEAWRKAWEVDPTYPLYSSDEFHPSPEGTYLAALTIVSRLSGRAAVGLTRRIASADGRVLLEVPPALALQFQKAADRAVESFRAYVPVDQP